MKNWKTKVGVVLLATFAVLMFFSKTIYAARLPKITGEMPKRGTLKNSYWGSGVVEWGEKKTVYLPAAGKISEILLEKGDNITEDQPLATMEYDADDANRGLEGKQQEGLRLALTKESLLLDIEKAKREIEFLEAPEIKDEKKSYQLELLEIDIKEASKRLKEVREEHNAGEATDVQLDSARYALQKLYLQQEQLINELEDNKDKAEKEQVRDEKSYEKEVADKKDHLAALEIQLSQLELEQENLKIDSQPYNKTLSLYEENGTIYPYADGKVTEIFVEQGESVQAGQKLLELGVSGSLVVKASAPLENDFIKVNDEVILSNANVRTKGKVMDIEITDKEKLLTISIEDKSVTPGETLKVEMEKESSTTYNLVPNNAVRKDKDGYFLNIIQQRDGIMGEEYFLSRLSIEIGESDATHTAVVKGINFYEPVAVRTVQDIATGQVVNLVNKEEFYSES